MTKVAENSPETIAKNLLEAEQQLTEFARNSPYTHRVTLVAVSKKHPPESVMAAAAAGQKHFAENYVQEGIAKIAAVNDPALIWHFIGPLQSNKTKDVAAHFDWVQSIEREKIARRLNDQRTANKAPLKVLLQVNIDDDDNKSGLSADEVMPLAEFVQSCDKLQLRGLMTILKAGADEQQQRDSFARMRELFNELHRQYGEQIDTLSMGMSGDMRQAVREGATMVRIGTAIFGQRE